ACPGTGAGAVQDPRRAAGRRGHHPAGRPAGRDGAVGRRPGIRAGVRKGAPQRPGSRAARRWCCRAGVSGRTRRNRLNTRRVIVMDLILRNARTPDDAETLVDIGIDKGRIAAIRPGLAAEGEEIQLDGRLVSPGFIETHIHPDKSCILDRCQAKKGDLDEAIGEVAKAKKAFTPEDVYERAKRTLEKCIMNGTTHMRTQLEVDPGIGLRGLEGVLPLIDEYKWAIDIEICIFPQEGLLNNPGTDELMVEALKKGGTVVGAAPYTDSDPHGQIDRIFEIAREFDIDIDMHLDFGPTCEDLDLDYVCKLADRFGRGGRTAIGHVTKLSVAPKDVFEAAARRMADAG